jgi:hypothetical protein
LAVSETVWKAPLLPNFWLCSDRVSAAPRADLPSSSVSCPTGTIMNCQYSNLKYVADLFLWLSPIHSCLFTITLVDFCQHTTNKQTPWPLVRERTIPTDRHTTPYINTEAWKPSSLVISGNRKV